MDMARRYLIKSTNFNGMEVNDAMARRLVEIVGGFKFLSKQGRKYAEDELWFHAVNPGNKKCLMESSKQKSYGRMPTVPRKKYATKAPKDKKGTDTEPQEKKVKPLYKWSKKEIERGLKKVGIKDPVVVKAVTMYFVEKRRLIEIAKELNIRYVDEEIGFAQIKLENIGRKSDIY